MRRFLHYLMLSLLVLCLTAAVVFFGAVSPAVAAPMYALVVTLVLLWAVRLLVADKVAWTSSPMHWPVAAFAVYAALRCLTSPVAYEARVELLQIVLYAFIYFLVAANFHRERDRTIVIVALMVLAVAESAYGLWQFATKSEAVLFLQRPGGAGSAGGTYVSHNHFGGFLEIVFGLLIARIALHRSAAASQIEHLVHKLIEGYVALIVAASLVASLSRGAWVGVTVSLIVFWVWVWGRQPLTPRSLALAAVLVVAVGLIGWSLSPVRQRLVESARARVAASFAAQPTGMPVTFSDKTYAGRTTMWMSTIRMMRDHPVFGTGPGTWEWFHLKYRDPRLQMRPQYAHNDVLQLGAEYGLMGLALVAWAFVCFFREAAELSSPVNSSGQRALAVGSGVAVTAVLVHSWFDFNMHIPANALLVVTVMGLTIAAKDGDLPGRRIVLAQRTRVGMAVALALLAMVAGWFGGRMALADYSAARGNDAREVLDWNRALAQYDAAIAWDSGFPAPHARVGDVYRTQATFQPAGSGEQQRLARQAVDAYRRALRLNRFDSDVMLRLAAAQELAGQIDEARQTYQQAVAVDPKSAFVRLRMGIFYRHIGEKELAIEAFEECSRLGPADNAARLNLQELQR